jgi:hypothetical protein
MRLLAAFVRSNHGCVRRNLAASRRAVVILAIMSSAVIGQAPSGVRAGLLVRPDTVRVGEPATLVVRVEAPVGTMFAFPPAVDSTARVEPVDPVQVREERRGDVIEAVATYRFLAWETGDVVIPIATVRLRMPDRTQDLSLGEPHIFVRSVLPADSAQRVPKPARAFLFLPNRVWLLWVLIGAGFLVAGLVGWLLHRRSHRVVPPLEPYADAQRAFGRLAALDLVGAGEPARHVTASADIVREYLAARDPRAGMALTTTELLAVVRADGSVPEFRLAALLAAADSLKFEHATIEAATARALASEAQALVAEIHRAELEAVPA